MDTDVSWFQTKTFPLSRMHDSVPHEFNTSGDYDHQMYETLDDAPHEFPSVFKPFPSSAFAARHALTDPTLTLTPERRMPTLARLRQSSGGEDRSNVGGDPLRESRVRFDQQVSIHHLSPPTDGNSPDISPRASVSLDALDKEDYSPYSDELSRNYLSYDYAATPRAGILRGESSALENEELDKDLNLSSYGFSPPSPNSDTLHQRHSPTNHALRSVSGDVAALDCSNMSDSNEPISVVASDLRRFTIDTPATLKSKKPFLNNDASLKSKTAPVYSDQKPAPSMKVYRSLPVVVERSGAAERSPPYRPLKDFGSLVGDGREARGADSCDEVQNALSKPELNSTLRVGRDIAKIKGSGFDVTESIRLRVNARTKMMIDEKAHYKLNHRAPQYSDLLSLDVQKEELLNRITEEKMARVRPGLDSTDRARRLEELVAKAPDIMDFFTPDLQKESISHTLNGTVSLQTPLQTAQLERAFDVYRHIRQWQQW